MGRHKSVWGDLLPRFLVGPWSTQQPQNPDGPTPWNFNRNTQGGRRGRERKNRKGEKIDMAFDPKECLAKPVGPNMFCRRAGAPQGGTTTLCTFTLCWSAWLRNETMSKLQGDGVHPSLTINRKWWNGWKFLRSETPEGILDVVTR